MSKRQHLEITQQCNIVHTVIKPVTER